MSEATDTRTEMLDIWGYRKWESGSPCTTQCYYINDRAEEGVGELVIYIEFPGAKCFLVDDESAERVGQLIIAGREISRGRNLTQRIDEHSDDLERVIRYDLISKFQVEASDLRTLVENLRARDRAEDIVREGIDVILIRDPNSVAADIIRSER